MPGVKAFSSAKMEKSRVCRCLFGKPDHNVIKKDLSESLKKSQKEAEVRWNFNFEKDEPLEGRYEWDVVVDQEYVPDFYKKGFVRKRCANIQRIPTRIGDLQQKMDTTSAIISSKDNDDSASDLSDLGCEILSDSEEGGNSSQEEKCNTDSETTIHRKRSIDLVQTQIDEFCKKRKRATVQAGSSSKKKRDH